MSGLKITGKVELIVRCAATGKVLIHDIENNLVVNLGKKATAKLIGGAGVSVTKIAVGEGTAPPAVTDTGLTNQFIKNISSVSYPADNKVQFSFSFDGTEANGMTITELGLYTSINELFSRKVRNPIVKTSTVIITGIWTITVS